MADTSVDEQVVEAPPARPHGGRHPSPKEYIRIAVILAVITAAEVVVYYIEGVQEFLVPVLFLFSALKFALVVLWFMHLKFDNKTYARFFLLGLAGAITLFLVMLLMFRVWS
jgi:cytochrome c oxidase subunit IV